jgi:hypothetical protein
VVIQMAGLGYPFLPEGGKTRGHCLRQPRRLAVRSACKAITEAQDTGVGGRLVEVCL